MSVDSEVRTAEPPSTIGRAVSVMEAVAAHGSSTAKQISERTGIPVPTVYRLAKELCQVDYLVHLREEKRFALGYRLHQLATSLHEDLGIRLPVRREIERLHQSTRMAAYLAIHRDTDFVVAYVVDSPVCPRIRPLKFGFRDFPHATAFGKLGLSEYPDADRPKVLGNAPYYALTENTITDDADLAGELDQIRCSGIAWEHEEFETGTTCAAVPLKSEQGQLLGSVAVSAPTARYSGQRLHITHLLRACAERTGRLYRLGV